VVAVATGRLVAQAPAPGTIPGVDQSYKAPRTPWGHPDLQGIFDGGSITPQQRPEKFADREFLTDEEVKALEKDAIDNPGRDARAERGSHADLEGAYNDVFTHRRDNYARTKRTGLIVDPPDGKMPPFTPEAEAKRKEATGRRAANRPGKAVGLDGKPLSYGLDTERPVADNPEERTADRCMGVGVPAPASVMRLVQSPTQVTIYTEFAIGGGAYRTAHLDGRPHLPSSFRFKSGHAVGKWEGDTLVIETTNFSAQNSYQGASTNLKLTERFTRVGDDLILYRITAEDPTVWTKPWTQEVAATILPNKENQIFESACHEGNYSMTGILGGARALEAEGKGRRK
jgi:hypothetical protein